MTPFNINVEHFFDGLQTHKNSSIKITNGIITDIRSATKDQPLLKGLLVPGFIDTQVNGGGGILFNQSPTIESILKIAKAHQKYGTTGWLPTLVTDSFKKMKLAADAVAEAINNDQSGVLGIHFEGPFLSTDKKGIHPESFIRKLTDNEFKLLTRKDLGKVVVTIAPENMAINDIERLSSAGVIICIGHSNASFEQSNAALNAGVTGFTHLFNAMSQFNSREPGVVGASLLDKKSYAGIILDGLHVHPKSARLAALMKSNLMLVTDAMPPVGSEQSEFEFFGQIISRHKNKLTDTNGRLAGSTLDMNSAVKNAIAMLEIDRYQAIKMATTIPANFLNLQNEIGTICIGQKANMLLLDNDNNIKSSWLNGKLL